MAMSMTKKAVGTALVGISSLALVGAGVGAVVTENVTGVFNVQTAKFDLQIVPMGSGDAEGPALNISDDHNSVTIDPAVLGVNAANNVSIGAFRVHNNGNVPMVLATDVRNNLPEGVHITILDTDNGATLDGLPLGPGSTRKVQVRASYDDLTPAQQGQTGSLSITVTGTATK